MNYSQARPQISNTIYKHDVKQTINYHKAGITPQQDGSVVLSHIVGEGGSKKYEHLKIPVKAMKHNYNQLTDSFDIQILSKSGKLRQVSNANVNGFNKYTGIETFDDITRTVKLNELDKKTDYERFQEKEININYQKPDVLRLENAIIEPAYNNGPLTIVDETKMSHAPKTKNVQLLYNEKESTYTVMIDREDDTPIIVRNAELRNTDKIAGTPGIEKFNQDYKRFEKEKKLTAIEQAKSVGVKRTHSLDKTNQMSI